MLMKIAKPAALISVIAMGAIATPAFSDHNGRTHGGKDNGTDTSGPTGVWENWMADDIEAAWTYQGKSYLGQNISITVVDDFSSRDRILGVLNGKITRKRHGEWTSYLASKTAPGAKMEIHDFALTTAVALSDTKFDVINASYGALYSNVPGSRDYFNGTLDPQEQTLVNAAADTTANGALVAKSAGNAGKAIGSPLDADDYGGGYEGYQDQLSLALKGKPGAIFVGALTDHGAGLADYSNFPGADLTYQSQFLVVGVDSSAHGIAGTSFAAPILAGYAAMVAGKFTAATPAQVATHLLSTATDRGNAYYFGQGEACILCAISPVSVQP